MINDVASDRTAARFRPFRVFAAPWRGFRQILVALGLRAPSFADRVEAHRRGTAEERRARRAAGRCVPALEQARIRLQRMARHLSEGGLRTTVKFSPIAYRIGVGRKGRKFGFAELPTIIVVSAGTATGHQTTALPVTVTATQQELMITPNFALLQTSEQRGVMVDLLLEAAHNGERDDKAFCERLEDVLARAIADGRLRV
jgi:hypothetical protein